MEGSGQGRAGTRFGHYELRRLVGRGGMGEVYEAYDTRKDRTVALKLLPSNLAADADYRRRFSQEAQVAARLQEPHVVPIHDFGEIDGLLYIDMRLVQGVDLAALLREHRRLEPDATLDIVRQVGDALDAAHADGLVHRDVKPGNVLVLPSGFAYLVDFGIATRSDESRLTTDGGAVGSLAYMAPERFSDERLTPACDIYALGCLAYELMTGRAPFRRETFTAIMHAHLHEEPTPASALRPDLPAAINQVIARAMAKDPSQRHASARALALDLARATGTGQLVAPGSAIGEVTGRSSRPAPRATAPAAPPPPRHPLPVAPMVSTAPQGRRSLGLAIGIGTAAVLVGAGGVAAFDGLTGDRGAAPAPAAHSGQPVARQPGQTTAGAGSTSSSETTSAPGSTSTSAPSPTSTTVTRTATVTSSPSSTRESSSSTSGTAPDVGPTISPGAGYDWQGWDESDARCNHDDRAVAVASAQGTRISICEVSLGGRTYYRATRNGDPIELDDPVASNGGWTVTNRSYRYRVGPDALTVTHDGEVIVDETLDTYVTP